MAEHDCIQVAQITELRVMVKNTIDEMRKSTEQTQTFINKFYEKDKPIIDDAKTFMRSFRKVFWIVMTPLIAGAGGGIIIIGFMIYLRINK